MTPVGFDTQSGTLLIVGNDVYPARTLTATLDGVGMVDIRSIAGRSEQFIRWDQITDLSGSGFQTADALMAYLVGEFGKSTPTVAPPTSYAINEASSFPVFHGLAYAPRVTVTDPAGAEVDTDTVHTPGLTTLTFAAPFTGTLYLG